MYTGKLLIFRIYSLIFGIIPFATKFHCHLAVDNISKYGSAVIYAIYFTVAWSTTQTSMELLVFHFFCSCLHMVDDMKTMWATC